MTDETGHTRRLLLTGGATLLAGALAQTAEAQTPAAPAASADPATPRGEVSPDAARLADYIAGTLDRPLPAEVAEQAKLHVLDTLGAMVSGARLKPGQVAAHYVRAMGGAPQCTVVGSQFRTSSVMAAFANAMCGAADETDDTDPIGPVHLGVQSVPAALAVAEIAHRSGADLLRAVTMGYDLGARICEAFGADEFSKRLTPSCMPGSFVAAAVSSALLRHDQRQVRHTLTYAAQQASGTGIWKRDREHIEKTFDYAGMGSRNGVMAATMVSAGFTAAEDPFSGDPNVFTALAEKPAPEKLLAGLGSKFAVVDTTIKKWTVGGPLQSVADSMYDLLKDPAVKPANVAKVTVELPAYSLSIVDNASTPDLCAQHLVAMMIVDHGATFKSVHDAERMKDPKVLAVRSLVTLKGSKELDVAKPARQAIVTIDTKDGKSLVKHTVYVRGLKENPMGADEVEAKALDLMGPVLGAARAKRLVAAVSHLETLGPVAKLRLLLQA